MQPVGNWAAAAVVSSLLLWVGTAAAATFTVTKSVDTNDGLCDADCSLREAIISANANTGADEISLPAGTYVLTVMGPPEDSAAFGDLDIRDALTLTGADAKTTIIQGIPSEPVIEQLTDDVTIQGVTVQGGTFGILIAASGSALTPKNLLIASSTLSGNSLAGMSAEELVSPFLTISDSTISGNGDGIALDLLNSTINGFTVSVTNSTISGNSLAGIRCQNLFDAFGSSFDLINVTIAENGVGILADTLIGVVCPFTLTNTILANDLSGGLNCNAFGATGIANGTVGGAGNFEDHPVVCTTGSNCLPSGDTFFSFALGPLQDNGGPTDTHALPPDPVCLAGGEGLADRAVQSACPPFDQRGQARLDGNLDGRPDCDPGAFELALTPSTTVTVTKIEDTNDGLCDEDCSLREAIIAANNTFGLDDIILPGGIHALTLSGVGEDAAATGDLDITDDLRLIGGGPSSTIIDGGGLDRVLHVIEARALISGLTIQNGIVSGADGGGALVESLSCCPTIGSLAIYRSAISGNQSIGSNGGGIAGDGSALIVSESILSGNSADGDGGGCYRCTDIVNSTISGNSADRGGGLFNPDSASLQSLTIAENSATTSGGGVDWNVAVVFKANLIIASNVGGACSQGSSGFAGLDDDGTCNASLSNVPPRLGLLQDNGGPTQTYALLSDSPAIDAGDPNSCTPTDQRGSPRTDGNGDGTVVCDLGAFERAGGSGTCDVNGDGGTDLLDVTLIRRELAGLPAQ